ncbi:MAG: hypothetical protein RR022_08515 [Angelakisella sp.]
MMKKGLGYPFFKTLRRMLQNVTDINPALYGWFALYTVTAVAAPVFPVLLPKLAITQLQGGTLQALLLQLTAFCVLWAVFLFGSVYLKDTTGIKLIRLRLDYMLENFNKLLTLKYCYREDATFYEKHQKALNATSNGTNGMEAATASCLKRRHSLFFYWGWRCSSAC